MTAKIQEKPAFKIIGIEVRTNNKLEFSGQGNIASQWQKFYQENINARIPNQINPDEVLGIYTEYESDANGDYTYIIGKEVSTLENAPKDLVAKTIPAAKYNKSTSEKGALPGIVIALWKQIWNSRPNDLGGERAYQTDLEVYDHRCSDPTNAELDLYISIK